MQRWGVPQTQAVLQDACGELEGRLCCWEGEYRGDELQEPPTGAVEEGVHRLGRYSCDSSMVTPVLSYRSYLPFPILHATRVCSPLLARVGGVSRSGSVVGWVLSRPTDGPRALARAGVWLIPN